MFFEKIEKIEKSKKSKIFKSGFSVKFWKISKFSDFLSDFQNLISQRFLNGFAKFQNQNCSPSSQVVSLFSMICLWFCCWCFEKLKLRSLRKVVRLFTKYASLGLCVAGFEKNTISMENHSVFWLKWHTQIVIWDQCFRQHSTPNLIDARNFSRHTNFFNGSNRPRAGVVCNLTCQRGREAP